jgi:hypothetical protein
MVIWGQAGDVVVETLVAVVVAPAGFAEIALLTAHVALAIAVAPVWTAGRLLRLDGSTPLECDHHVARWMAAAVTVIRRAGRAGCPPFLAPSAIVDLQCIE